LQYATIIWLVIAVVFAAVELSTTQLVSVWFAAGALGAMLCAALQLPFWLQFLAFAVVSAVLMFFTRPIVRRATEGHIVRTNADRVIGQIALVLSEIGGGAGGQVKCCGSVWSAVVPSSDIRLAPGDHALVLAIEGVKLVVDRADNPNS
jgi:membrane protein implicated in regulation of membrane protease activity